MFAMKVAFVLSITVFSNFEIAKSGKVEARQKLNDVPSSVDSRFFDLGGIINQLFSGFNQGNQPPGRGPGGIDFPGNSQFYPGGPIQTDLPPKLINEDSNHWPMIDDAKWYPNHKEFENGHGFQPGFYPDLPDRGFGGVPQGQYLNPGNANSFGRYPSHGYENFEHYPNQGGFGGFQNQNRPEFHGIQNQYPNWANDAGYTSPFPSHSHNGNTVFPYPIGGINSASPSIPEESKYEGYFPTPNPDSLVDSPSVPNHKPEGFDRPSHFGDSEIYDESVDTPEEPQKPNVSIPTPGEIPSGTARPQWPEDNGKNSILGKPVLIPETSTSSGQIVFPESTESAAQKQCVQDCESPTDYNPVCGTNNITYINPGKFACARNCGVHVFVKQKGRCV